MKKNYFKLYLTKKIKNSLDLNRAENEKQKKKDRKTR